MKLITRHLFIELKSNRIINKEMSYPKQMGIKNNILFLLIYSVNLDDSLIKDCFKDSSSGVYWGFCVQIY